MESIFHNGNSLSTSGKKKNSTTESEECNRLNSGTFLTSHYVRKLKIQSKSCNAFSFPTHFRTYVYRLSWLLLVANLVSILR